jgi:hypothetical protein
MISIRFDEAIERFEDARRDVWMRFMKRNTVMGTKAAGRNIPYVDLDDEEWLCFEKMLRFYEQNFPGNLGKKGKETNEKVQ